MLTMDDDDCTRLESPVLLVVALIELDFKAGKARILPPKTLLLVFDAPTEFFIQQGPPFGGFQLNARHPVVVEHRSAQSW
jgi:hypothetical protein